MAEAEINENPFQGEFFSADLPERLVRESIQNSLDARADGDCPVTVRFSFSGASRALSPSQARPYLAGLEPHFQAVVDAELADGHRGADGKAELASRRDLFGAAMPFLAIEDFGTTGLRGDIRENGVRAMGNDFWGFFRSIGISPKGDDSAGSWGLGKWVFPDASRLNAFIGLTHRQGERRHYMMGQAMLRLHTLRSRRYPPVGFYAIASDRDDSDWLPLPADSSGAGADLISDAMARFSLREGFGSRRRESPGTSIVIPHPKAELADPGNVVRAVIGQYFHPLVRSDLAVEIVFPDGSLAVIDRDTIVDVTWRYFGDQMDGEQSAVALESVIRLAQWGLAQDDGALAPSVAQRRHRPLADDGLKELRRQYRRGKRLGFRVRSTIHGRPSHFRVLLEKDDALREGHDYFIRGHLNVPRMDYLTRHRARALVVVDNTTSLGHLLRDSEGPSHERWRADAPRLRKRGWPAGAERVREVQHAAARIIDQLAEETVRERRHALADLFPGYVGRKAVRRKPVSAGPRPAASKPALRARPVPGGFEVGPGPGNVGPSGRPLTVRVAYDVAQGGASRAFRSFERGRRAGNPDFSLLADGVVVEARSCRSEVESDNQLALHIDAADFVLRVTGFDDRDLIVDVSPPADSDGEAPGSANGGTGTAVPRPTTQATSP